MIPAKTVKQVRDFLASDGDLLVVTHIYPDGDAIGSLLAFSGMLDVLSIPHDLAVDAVPPHKYGFLNGFERVRRLPSAPLEKKYKRWVILDAGALARAGTAQEGIGDDTVILNIDHHFTGAYFGHINLVDVEASATSEILFDLCGELGIVPNAVIANALYVGILTDTGRFRFSNTTPRALAICSELIQRGANPGIVTENVYYNIPFPMLQALGRTLTHVELYFDGLVSLIYNDDQQYHGDTEGFVEYAASIEGVSVAALITRLEPGQFKVSIRSRSTIDVSNVANRFKGGGHRKAAGFRYSGDGEELRRGLLRELSKELNDNGVTHTPDITVNRPVHNCGEWRDEWVSE